MTSLPELRHHEFPLIREVTYLDTATQGPLSRRTHDALALAVAQAQVPGTSRSLSGQATEALARMRMAQLLDVAEDALVFTPNTTHGMILCAHGITWRPGDNVVLPAREFPALVRTWLGVRAAGVDVRLAPWSGAGPTVADVMAVADGRTRVIACSAVAWDTGWSMDLAELGHRCRAAGILLVVDGIQAVGAVPLAPQALGLAALSFHGYKWLMAGFGCGVLYLAPAALEQIQPRFVGEQSYRDGADPWNPVPAWRDGASRFAVGSANILGMTALASALTLVTELGLAQIARHHAALTQELVDGLRALAPAVRLVVPDAPERRAAIVVFTTDDAARDAALVAQLAARQIVVACRPRGIRVAPHLFNDAADIGALLRALAQLTR